MAVPCASRAGASENSATSRSTPQGDVGTFALPVNTVTHYSQEVTDYDRATDFEALGGKLIEGR